MSSHRSPATLARAAAVRFLCVALALAPAAPAAAARDARDVPIVDQTGATFTLRALHRPTAVIFIDTDCHDACAIAEAVFARLADRLRQEHVDARLVTITLDPAHEPPIVMANAARKFGADPARWRWASGQPRNVEDLMGAFDVVHVNKKVHSTFAYVLDARGLPVRVIPLSTVAGAQLFAALRQS